MESFKKPVVLAIGIFDGVHLGHQMIFKKTLLESRRAGAIAAALTFPSHPSRILTPRRVVPLMQTFAQRSDTIRSFGIQKIYPLLFTKRLSRLSPARFVEYVLFRHWNLCGVVVGRKFRFGYKRSGGIAELDQLLATRGATLWPVKPVRIGKIVVQSTIVRRELAAGRIEWAERLLGRAVELVGRSERGSGLGGKTGAHTINLVVANEMLPKFGVYAGWLKMPAGRRPVVMNLGVAPTLRDGRKVLLEVHVLDGKPVHVASGRGFSVDLVKFLRPERKFASLSMLKQAIQKDVQHARRILIWKKH